MVCDQQVPQYTLKSAIERSEGRFKYHIELRKEDKQMGDTRLFEIPFKFR